MVLMRMNKRAVWALPDFLYFFFYVGLTFTISFVLVQIPDSILNDRLQTGNLGQVIDNDRVNTMLAYKDPYSGRFDYDKISSANLINNQTAQNLIIFPDKERALFLSLDGKKAYMNKKYYDIAKPLAPIRYTSLVNRRQVEDQKDKSFKILTIEQVYKRT